MRLVLNEKFYSLKAVKLAALAYKKIANFSISNTNNKIFVDVGDIDKEIEPEFLKNEFLNYALALNIRFRNIS